MLHNLFRQPWALEGQYACSSDCSSLSAFASLTVLGLLVRVVVMLPWVLATGSAHYECFLETDKIGQAAEFPPSKLPVGMHK